MLRLVALVRTDGSEDLSASIIRVTRIGELGTTLAVTNIKLTYVYNVIYRQLRHKYRQIQQQCLSVNETMILRWGTHGFMSEYNVGATASVV
jgi:hypothetical protein